jgi:hypothetical protein
MITKEMIELEKEMNMAYNKEHGIEASPQKPRGTNKTPKKKKRKK